MTKLNKAIGAGAVLGLLGGVAALFGPFITSEAVEGVLERGRRLFPVRRRHQ